MCYAAGDLQEAKDTEQFKRPLRSMLAKLTYIKSGIPCCHSSRKATQSGHKLLGLDGLTESFDWDVSTQPSPASS
jgi:hypothetical protein